MKIGLVYDCLYPYIKGGAEKRYYEIGRRLAKDHEVHFFGMKSWSGFDDLKQNGCLYHGCGKKRELYNEKGKRKISQAILFSFSVFPKLLKTNLDVIDCSSFPYFPVFSCRLAAWIKRKPLIVTWHEVWDNYWFEYMGSLGFFGKLVEKIASKLPDKIIAVSEKTKRDLVSFGVNPKKIVVIPNGIDFEAIQKIKPAKKGFDLVFAGRLIPEKNVSLLIDAVELVVKTNPKLTVGIIGDGPEFASIQRKVKEKGLEKNVSLLGFLDSQEEVYAIFKASKALAFPSLREGFGITVLEANACGIPAVVCESSWNASVELISNGINGKISASDALSLAGEFKSVVSTKWVSERMRKIAAPFDWVNIQAQSSRLYGGIQ